jgi:starch synthase
LDDTIVPYDEQTGEGTGFKFGPYKATAFIEAIRGAVRLFPQSKVWQKLLANGMKADFSWERSARDYLALYESLLPK